MMVTFVSQCEKKALKRTRRVLDSFADRIGTNTWQTIITQEGLLAVRTLLRKTATKNTAVSCHWIRGRALSELVWLVGNKNKFSKSGRVPVNVTKMELIMNGPKLSTVDLLANSEKQSLDLHLFSVGYLASFLVDKLTGNKSYAKSAFVGGCFHDVGKIDPQFQLWLAKKIKSKNSVDFLEDGVHIDQGKFTFENHPRHNEISLIMYALLIDQTAFNRPMLRRHIPHSILWHHAKPFRKINYKSLEDIYKQFTRSLTNTVFDEVFDRAITLIKSIDDLAKKYDKKLPTLSKSSGDCDIGSLQDFKLPPYKIYSELNDNLRDYRQEVKDNAISSLIRAAVISADRAVSAMTRDTLGKHFKQKSLDKIMVQFCTADSKLLTDIEVCLGKFEADKNFVLRNQQQAFAAKKLVKIKTQAAINDGRSSVSVLQGPAGCGKTKIALEWGAKTGVKKIWWICPRVQVCLGLFEELKKEHYLPKSRIEIFTGDYKETAVNGAVTETDQTAYFSGDIIITTIDQAVNTVISHGKVTALIELMNAHVVFDEFHELVSMPAFNLLFSELIECKAMRGTNADTLLISATPNYFFLEQVLGIKIQEECVRVPSTNSSIYDIQFDVFADEFGQNSALNQPQRDNTFVITNTAKDAQVGFLRHIQDENAVLLHSRFTAVDKRFWFQQVMNSFSDSGSRQFDVLRSGPIVQASLNITCDKMLTDFTTAENWLQRLGRLDRFGVNDEPNQYITVIAQSIVDGKQLTSTARFLNKQYLWASAQAWYHFLVDQIGDNNKVTLNTIYDIYHEFYQDENSLNKMEQDLKRLLCESTKIINQNVLDPTFVPIKRSKLDGIIKMKQLSLRGNNRFVQMAICEVSSDGTYTFPEDYVYDEATDHSQVNIGALLRIMPVKDSLSSLPFTFRR